MLCGIIGLSALMSLSRGFVKETISLVSWVTAGFMAWTFGATVAEYLDVFIVTPSIRAFVAAILIFVVTLLVGALANRFLGALVTATGMMPIDKLLGIGFGAIRGGLVAVLLVGLISMTPIAQDPAWKNAEVLPFFLGMVEWAKEVAGDAFNG